MIKPFRPLAYASIVAAALSLASCGTTPLAPAPTDNAVITTRIATIHIGPSVTRDALQAAMPQARILSFNPEAGNAILSVADQSGKLQAASVQSHSLDALGATVVAVEPDVELKVMADGDPEAMGSISWAGGTISWAGGTVSWAGSVNFLDVGTYVSVAKYWTMMGIPTAQALVPEQGAGVKVAVIDTGIDLKHPLLTSNIDSVNDWDFVNNDDTPQEEQLVGTGVSKYGHGTAVAGVILQYAPKAQIIALRALKPDGAGTASNVVAALDRAVKVGAKVINISLGSSTDTLAINTAIKNALAAGVMVVNSSGNTGTEGMLYPARNAGNAQFPTTSGFFAVGSVTDSLSKSSFTSYGTNMTLTAPGEKVLTVFPDARLIMATGTSFAAPAVSGALALAISAGQTNPATLSTYLRSGVTPNTDIVYKPKLGAGTLNAGAFVRNFR